MIYDITIYTSIVCFIIAVFIYCLSNRVVMRFEPTPNRDIITDVMPNVLQIQKT